MSFISTDWRETASKLALQIRLGFNVEAGLLLVGYVETLVNAYPQFPAAQQRQFQLILSAMLKCQETQDWIGLADYLEYELQQFIADLNL